MIYVIKYVSVYKYIYESMFNYFVSPSLHICFISRVLNVKLQYSNIHDNFVDLISPLRSWI